MLFPSWRAGKPINGRMKIPTPSMSRN
jgi:hypothetical protein